MSLKERLLELVSDEGLNPNQFYLRTKLANGFLNTVGETLRRPSIEKIETAFPHWNIEWILTGKGDKLRETRSSINNNTSSKIEETNGTRKRLVSLIESNGDTLDNVRVRANISEQSLNELLYGHDAIDIGLLFKVTKLYGNISLKWLLKGEGEMYSDDLEEQEELLPQVNISRPKVNYKLLPIINLDIVGGNNNVEADTAEYIMGYIPFVEAREGDVCCFISGNSMNPLYPAGVAVQIRKVELWQDFVEFGNVYVLDLIDGRRLIKEIRKGKNEDCFTLHSYNADYEDVPIPKRIIRSVWQVIQKLEKVTMW